MFSVLYIFLNMYIIFSIKSVKVLYTGYSFYYIKFINKLGY